MAKGAIEVAADFSEMGFAMGLISGMAKEVKTDRYLGDVVSYVHKKLSNEFDMHMDFARAAAPKRFSHVYEWDTHGGKNMENDRLWEHKLLGQGGKRNATFIWKASIKPIPSPQERAQDPNDPMHLVPKENLDKLSKRRYFFYWKAPVMEYNQGVNIAPKYASALFIPTGDPANPFVFANEYRNLQPGGQESTGAFTGEWTAWWGTEAPASFEKNIQPALEEDLGGIEGEIRQGQRSRKKTVSLAATSDYAAAFDSGEAWAMEYMRKKSKKYKARSK